MSSTHQRARRRGRHVAVAGRESGYLGFGGVARAQEPGGGRRIARRVQAAATVPDDDDLAAADT